jgi:hypothetical protein
MISQRPARKFAEGTAVSTEKTQAEIRRLLERYGSVDGYVTGEQAGIAVLTFNMRGRRLLFRMSIPRVKPGASGREAEAAQAETRRLWRSLALCIKAKLESVRSGIESFEDAFLAQTVLPTGQTVGEWAGDAIPQALDGRPLPPLLTGPRQ